MSRLTALVAVSALWLGTFGRPEGQNWLVHGAVISKTAGGRAASPWTAQSAPGTQSVRMKRVSIMDTQGFGQPVEAFSFLAPADWQITGGVEWVASFNCTPDMIRVHLRATAPDGLTGFELFPDQNWQWSDDPMANEIAALAMREGG